MSRTIDTVHLEHLLNALRNELIREPGESIETFMKRTWQLALVEVKTNTPPLPNVEATRQRSDRLLAAQLKKGPIVPEKEEE